MKITQKSAKSTVSYSQVLLAALCLTLASCSKKEAPQHEFLAKVGDKLIQRQAFEPELERRTRSLPRDLSDNETKRAVLDEIVRFEALYAKAKSAGIDQNPEIQRQIRQLIVRNYEEGLRAKLPATEVTDIDIQNYYAANQPRFTDKEQRQGSVIFLSVPMTASEARKRETREKAESIRRQALAPADAKSEFGALTQKHSDDRATRYAGGNMGRLELDGRYNRWERPVVAALFALEKRGDIAPLVQTPKGLYVVRLTDVTTSRVKPLSAVRGEIHHILAGIRQTQREQTFQTVAIEGIDIAINKKALAAIPVPREALTAAKPPSMPAR